MEKDYTGWHKKKTKIQNSTSVRLFFNERDVWWCSTGSNIGYEQDGKGQDFTRPVLIFKKFNNEIFWALPLSTIIKTSRFYAPLNLRDDLPRVVILSQLRLMDGKRLANKIGSISKENYQEIQKAIIKLCS